MRFIKHLLVMSLVLIIIPINILTNDLDGKFIIKNFINHFDSCFPTYLKEKIKGGNRHDFIFSSPLNLDTVSYDEFNEYYHCLSYIDTLLKNDSVFKNYFRDLLEEYYRPIEEIIYKNYYHHLNNEPIDFDHDIDSLWEMKRVNDSMMTFRETADTINGYYIPISLDDALKHIPDIVSQDEIIRFKNIENEEEAIGIHFNGWGMTFRNIWWLGNSRLSAYFKRYGINNLWDESIIILHSWYRQLHNKPINFDEQVNENISK